MQNLSLLDGDANSYPHMEPEPPSKSHATCSFTVEEVEEGMSPDQTSPHMEPEPPSKSRATCSFTLEEVEEGMSPDQTSQDQIHSSNSDNVELPPQSIDIGTPQEANEALVRAWNPVSNMY